MSRAWALVFIVGLMGLCQFGLALYEPSLPAMVSGLHSSVFMIQLSVSIYLITTALSQFIFGPLSDIYGRRPLLLAGMLLFCVTSVMAMCATSSVILLIARGLQGIGIGVASGLSRAIARDVFTGKALARSSSYQSLAWMCGTLFSPLLGGYIQEWFSWQMNFALLAILGIFAFFTIFFKYQETLKKPDKNRTVFSLIWQAYKNVLTHKVFLGSVVSIITTFTITVTIVQLCPFIFQHGLGFSPSQYGWVLAVLGIIGLAAGMVNIRLVNRFSLNNIILVAFIVILIVVALAIILAEKNIFNLWVMILPLIVVRIATAFIYPNSVTNAMSEFKGMAGSAGSLLGGIIYLFSGLATIGVTQVHQAAQLTLFIAIFSASIIGALAFLLLVILPLKPKALLSKA